MKYSKPPLSFEEQAELLVSRGLEADKNELIKCLENVSYYRLSGYLFPFRNSDESFIPGTSLKQIWTIYRFDRQFRLIVLDAIERVEIAVKTVMVYHFSKQFGPFGYTQSCNFPRIKKPDDYLIWIADIKKEIGRSKEDFILHFTEKYGDCHTMPPLWMASEVFTFGKVLTMFTIVHNDIRKLTARYFHVEDKVLESWLRALNGVRNISAHHGRLWNRKPGYKPLLPGKNKNPEWHADDNVSNDRIYIILLILRYLLKTCAPASNWPGRVESLIDEFDTVPLKWMGFPDNWKEHPLWRIT